MRITVLTYLEKEAAKKYDAAVTQVLAALRQRQHRVSVLGVHASVPRLISGLSRRQPDLVFNLMESFGDNLFGEVAVAGLLDLMGLKHTGGGPGEIYLRQDKALAK